MSCSTGYMEIIASFEDAYGDGWNGAVASVFFDGTLYDPMGLGFTYTMTAEAPNPDVQSFCIDQTGLAGCLEIVVGGGTWDSEISWSLVDGATAGAAFALAGGAETIEINCPVPGCTDSSACNFSADATEDDGSCTYAADACTDCDGNDLGGQDCAGVCGGSSVVDCAGVCGGSSVEDECGVCDGSGPVEGYDCDGNVVCGDGQLEIVATFSDSWGDGWNGAVASVYFDGVLYDPMGLGFTYTMVSGSEETVSFCVDQTGLAGCLQIVVGGGSYDSEISWSLVDGATGGAAFALSGVAETVSINCPVLGCTDETAANYNPDATEDDGTCVSACTDLAWTLGGGSYISETSFTITDADGNEVAAGTGSAGSGSICLGDGCYDVNMADSWGDGWNGNVLTIGDASFELVSGEAGSSPLDINGGGCGIVNGCTDSWADNYNADANLEDGSCEYSCEYLLSYDSYLNSYDNSFSNYYCDYYMYSIGGYTIDELEGYGYNCDCVTVPVYGCTDESAANYNADATLDDGTCSYDCAEGVSVTLDGGSWQTEVSWNITDCDGNELASGFAPFTGCLEIGSDYIVNMYDSYGDGWNGNILTIGDSEY